MKSLSLKSLPRPVLLAMASCLGGTMVLYAAMWMFHAKVAERANPGIIFGPATEEGVWPVRAVMPNTPADRAGLRPGDQIAAGRRLLPFAPLPSLRRTGMLVHLRVTRPGVERPFDLPLVTGPHSASWPHFLLVELNSLYMIPYLAVGLGVLFLRLDDRYAWLLALLFAGFIAGAPLSGMLWTMPFGVRSAMLGWRTFFYGMLPALMYTFFAVFPARSLPDLRAPWLKKVLAGAAAAVSLPLAVGVWQAGSERPLDELAQRLGPLLSGFVFWIYYIGVACLALASLIWNSLHASDADARRKSAVLVWGAIAGTAPVILHLAASRLAGASTNVPPPWRQLIITVPLILLPVFFAYAVVRHRVLEVPALLRRSARYLLAQRGLVIAEVLAMVAATVVFVSFISRTFQPRPELAVPVGVLVGVLFGFLLASAGTELEQRIMRRLDRAFFRHAYDARQVLEALADRARAAVTREELAALLHSQLSQALHPSGLWIYLEREPGRFRAEAGNPPPGAEEISIEQMPQPGAGAVLAGEPDSESATPLRLLAPECVAPLTLRSGAATGMIVLGPRLSDEPYSREDRKLLATVAAQAAAALESIQLAEKIAERMEHERRTAHEMEIAMRVQERLYPEHHPPTVTLDYEGRCIQARAIGGDYYDFVSLAPGRVGLVLADICGKGIGAALLMANLQAHLRGHYALAADDFPGMLRSVNQRFFGSTPAASFATLFFADYDDRSRRLRYANCGHNAPLLLRASGEVQWLPATATVLGLFAEWDCTVGEVELASEDRLVIFSDGLPDAENEKGEQFGDERIVATVRRFGHLSAPAMLEGIVEIAQQFTGREREDDLTLVVARAV